jgi:hypothetical protein
LKQTFLIVQANPDKPWNFESLPQNPNITGDIIKAIEINLGIFIGYLNTQT